MREFIYFSNSARTSGNFSTEKLMDAGRMDIAIHVLINAFFLSHKLREDTKIHLIFNGPPNPPQHLELFPGKSIPETGKSAGDDKPDISKRDIRNIKFDENPVFILADHHGFNKKELKKLLSYGTPVSVGKQTYFASQVVT